VGKVMRRSKQRASNEYAGVYNSIDRTVREGKRDLGQSTSAIKGSYGGAGKAIKAIGGTIAPQTGQIAQGFTGSLGHASDLLGGGGNIGQAAAAGAMSGTLAGNTLSNLWSNARTDQGYNRGMGEALVFDRQRMMQQARLRYQEVIDEAQRTREATAREEAARAAEIADTLRAQRASRRLAEWMAKHFAGLIDEGGDGGGGGGVPDHLNDPNYAPGGPERAAIQHGTGALMQPSMLAPAAQFEPTNLSQVPVGQHATLPGYPGVPYDPRQYRGLDPVYDPGFRGGY
jgi:hypothetical protein